MSNRLSTAACPVAEASKLSLGVSLGGAQQKANLSSVVWGTQYNGQGFDPTLNSGESVTNFANFYFDLGAGLYYEYSNRKVNFSRDDEKRLAIGVAYFHLNRPQQKMFSVSEKLYGKLVVNINGHFDRFIFIGRLTPQIIIWVKPTKTL